jgi:hypothetical protein
MRKSMIFGTNMVLMCAILLFFCNCAETKLKSSVEAANKDCPISLGMSGEMTSVTYEDNAVVFLFTFDEQFVNIDALDANQEGMKASVLAGMRNKNTQNLFDMVIESDADIFFKFKGKTSGKEASFRITASELKEELEKPVPTTEEKLALTIEQTNQQMPMDTGTGVIITKVVDEDETVTYLAMVNDKKQLDMIAENIDNVKNSQKTMFKMMGMAEKVFFQMIIEAGKNLSYRYYSEGTDKTVEVIHTNAELKEIFGN